jgi:hypothetical protein
VNDRDPVFNAIMDREVPVLVADIARDGELMFTSTSAYPNPCSLPHVIDSMSSIARAE